MRKIIITALLLFLFPLNAQTVDFEESISKIEAYVATNEYTILQIRNATPLQWRNHVVAAGFTTAELSHFGKRKTILRNCIITRMKDRIWRTQVNSFLIEARKITNDDQLYKVFTYLAANPEEWINDPNSL